jgi:hypothetical protein
MQTGPTSQSVSVVAEQAGAIAKHFTSTSKNARSNEKPAQTAFPQKEGKEFTPVFRFSGRAAGRKSDQK